MKTVIKTALSVLGILGMTGVCVAQQSPAPNATRLSKYMLSVADLDGSISFYRALGIELREGSTIGKPEVVSDLLARLVDAPSDVSYRSAVLRIPGVDFIIELMEFSGLQQFPVTPRVQDPGAALLILQVRDVDASLAAVKASGADVVTPGGIPLRGPNARAVLVQDFNGFFVLLRQPNSLPSVSGPLVFNARWATVVQDVSPAQMYGSLGFEITHADGDGAGLLLETAGVRETQYRGAAVQMPGAAARWSFYEYKDIDRQPYIVSILNPGAPAIGIEVRDINEAESTFKAAGGSVITRGGSVQLPNGDKLAFVRDPSGVVVEIAQRVIKAR